MIPARNPPATRSLSPGTGSARSGHRQACGGSPADGRTSRWTWRLRGPAGGRRGLLHDDRTFGLRRGDRPGVARRRGVGRRLRADRPLFPNILAAAAMLLVRQQKEVKAGDAVREVVAESIRRVAVSHLSSPALSLGPTAANPARRGEEHHLAAGRPGQQRDELLDLEPQGDGPWSKSIGGGRSTFSA